jgi:hypothetical protein
MFVGLIWMREWFEEGDDFTLYHFMRLPQALVGGSGVHVRGDGASGAAAQAAGVPVLLTKQLRGVLHAAPGVMTTLTGKRATALHMSLHVPGSSRSDAAGQPRPFTVACIRLEHTCVAALFAGTLPVAAVQVSAPRSAAVLIYIAPTLA